MTTFNIQPRLNLFTKGTCFKTKYEFIAHKEPGITSTDKTLTFDSETKIINKKTVLIFLEDKQFYSASKELRQPMSAWIRAKVITPLGEILWITLYCENKAIWDFKTYNGKKNSILNEVGKSLKVISNSINSKAKKALFETELQK